MKFKFKGVVKAGFPSPAIDYREKEIDLKEILQPNETSTFVVQVEGNSMEGAHIPHNCLVVVDRSLKPANNSIIVATLNGETIIKYFNQVHSGMFLTAAHPSYKPLQITEGTDFAIWGIATHAIIDLKK